LEAKGEQGKKAKRDGKSGEGCARKISIHRFASDVECMLRPLFRYQLRYLARDNTGEDRHPPPE